METWRSYLLPHARTRDLQARSGKIYRLDLFVPEESPPESGYPAVYLLDGRACFGTCVEAVLRMGRRPDATGVSPCVVIAISSSDALYDTARREQDFLPEGAGIAADRRAGGAEAFLDFLVDNVLPAVAEECRVDPARSLLFGHSLAGFFTLWALATRPASFRSYAAISPSIWAHPAGLSGLPGSHVPEDLGVLIAVGAWEATLPPWQKDKPGAAEVLARRTTRDMVGQARSLAERLRPALGERLHFAELADEDHASIVSAAIPRALRLTCAP